MNRIRNMIGCDHERCRRYTGRNVGIAILDTGIFLHEDFRHRVTAFYDVVNQQTMPYDDNGHGTHIAGIACGDGRASGGRYCGIAPGARVIAVKILDRNGNGTVEGLTRGVDWVLEHKARYGIRVVNISIGMFPKVGSADRNTIIRSVERLWDQDMVVVVAAGNNGPAPGTVTYPGISRKVITVGTVQEKPSHKNFSGKGPTPFCIVKPEIIAPGFRVMSCANSPSGYTVKSGTSMATPVVSGAICRLMEKEPALSPLEVKMKLHDGAKNLGLDKNTQGWGMVWLPDLLQ